MYLIKKINVIFISGILVAMLIVAPIIFLVLYSDKSVKNANIKRTQFEEQKSTRTQDEIWAEYEKNINGLLSLVNSSEEDIEVILLKMEAVFFSIRVPSEKRNLYFKTFLQIQKLKSDGSIDSKKKLREDIVSLLTVLLNNDKKI